MPCQNSNGRILVGVAFVHYSEPMPYRLPCAYILHGGLGGHHALLVWSRPSFRCGKPGKPGARRGTAALSMAMFAGHALVHDIPAVWSRDYWSTRSETSSKEPRVFQGARRQSRESRSSPFHCLKLWASEQWPFIVRGPQFTASSQRSGRNLRSATSRCIATCRSADHPRRPVEASADTIYPCEGFYRRIPGLAAACAAAGISFVDAAPKCLSWLGISLAPSRRPAAGAVLMSSAPSASVDELCCRLRPAHAVSVHQEQIAGGGGGVCVVSRRLSRRFRGDRSRQPGSRVGVRGPTVSRSRHCQSTPSVRVWRTTSARSISMSIDCSVRVAIRKVIEPAPAPHLDAVALQDIASRYDYLRPRRHIEFLLREPVELLDAKRGVCLHRDESAGSGGAHGDRGGYRRSD